MFSRLYADWTDFTRGEKAALLLLSPVAMVTGFAVGLIAAIYLLTSPLFGA